ncbi:MAG: transposase [Deltaproteobacteria bacterium]|nr:transposase [Deltaproteobacteria bacterium]
MNGHAGIKRNRIKKRVPVLSAPECSGGERSEPERNGGALKPGENRGGNGREPAPPPEVLERPKRRRFSAEYKARIVEEADGCTQPGAVGRLLRREGLYSSQLSKWRDQYRQEGLSGLRDDKRGRKRKKSPAEVENEKLRKQLARLERRLMQAETILDIQKKASEMLGIPLRSLDENGEDD